jgi:glycine betaine catabolism B
MNERKAIFLGRISRTPDIESFRFEPETPLDFLPGQFAQVIFDETNRSNKDLNKYLSFSCAPGKSYIEVTKRRSGSAFSGKLWGMKKGDPVLLKGPLGNCVLNEAYKKMAFLTGGIGITPVISMLETIMEKKLATDVWLLYSNRTEKDIAFRGELDAWAAQNNNIKIAYTVVECAPSDQICFLGMIDANFVVKKVQDCSERVFFTFGPPGMVNAMKGICSEIGCSTGSVKTENFTGY